MTRHFPVFNFPVFLSGAAAALPRCDLCVRWFLLSTFYFQLFSADFCFSSRFQLLLCSISAFCFPNFCFSYGCFPNFCFSGRFPFCSVRFLLFLTLSASLCLISAFCFLNFCFSSRFLLSKFLLFPFELTLVFGTLASMPNPQRCSVSCTKKGIEINALVERNENCVAN